MNRSKPTPTINKLIFLAVAAAVALAAVAIPAVAQTNSTTFKLYPNPKFESCLGVAGGPTPVATVRVTRGNLADTLLIQAKNIKPNLAFDMFTTQRTNLLSDGTADPAFTNFGLAWYQTDLQADSTGKFSTTIKTILLDQIFGFDADLSNPNPINAFHVGFWFNNPNDANVDGCTFDVTKPTPFNGEHNAGPNAMMSVPDATTGLGPLCTNPGSDPGTCNP